jgi:hypothetical protein
VKEELFETIDDKKGSCDEVAVRVFGEDEIKKMLKSGEFDDVEYETLFDIYEIDMPYGTKKARTGDPYKFIYDRLAKIKF